MVVYRIVGGLATAGDLSHYKWLANKLAGNYKLFGIVCSFAS